MTEAHRPGASFPDRSGRLTVFGILAILAGGALMLLGLLYVGLPFLLPQTHVAWPSVLMGALTYLLLGAILVWAGVGSLRKRRWVRAVMLSLAWTWLLTGSMMLTLSAFLLDDMLAAATFEGPAVSSEVLLLTKIIVMAMLAGGGVVLPGLFVLAYRDRAVVLTCERANPERGFADDCPVPVLGLSLGLGAVALLTLPLALNPVVPLFGKIVVGLPGAALTLALAGACALLALWTFRLEARGWWGATILMILLGASTAVTFAVADPDELFEAMAQSGGRELGLGDSGPLLIGITLLVTACSVVYMLVIRRHFLLGRQ